MSSGTGCPREFQLGVVPVVDETASCVRRHKRHLHNLFVGTDDHVVYVIRHIGFVFTGIPDERETCQRRSPADRVRSQCCNETSGCSCL